MAYVTIHIQKDGRINLGRAAHRTYTCHTLKNRETYVVQIEGEIVSKLPQCKLCWKLGSFKSEQTRIGFDGQSSRTD